MKKFFSAVLSVLMLLSLATDAFAASGEASGEGSGEMPVSIAVGEWKFMREKTDDGYVYGKAAAETPIAAGTYEGEIVITLG